MGWKPGKYLKKAIKGVAKGIKKIGKGIGKAFKKVFKGIGKFVGKLGPIGMLGMMLIMPQLGAWWGQFGTWAQGLSGPLSSVMKGVHWAGSKVGTAMTTVTEGIQKTLNVVTGGTFSTAGTAGYEAGFSDNFANWMSGQLDKGREFLGLETATPIGTPDIDVTDVVTETTVPDTKTVSSAYSASDQQVIDQINSFSDYPNIQESLTANLSPEGLKLYNSSRAVSPFSDEMLVDLGIDPKSDPSTWMEQGTTTIKPVGFPDMSTWDKIVDKGEKLYKGAKTFSEAQDLYASYTDDYDIGTGWNNYVADNMVGYYESANVDWIGQGMAGQSHYGMGNDNFFRSVYNLGQNNPDLWFLDMGVVKR